KQLRDQRPDALMALEIAPPYWTVVAEHAAADLGEHRHLAARSGITRGTAVAQSHETEHRLLRCRLWFLVAWQYGKNQRFPGRTPRMRRVERCREVGDRIELSNRARRELCVRIAAEQVSPEAQRRLHFSAA